VGRRGRDGAAAARRVSQTWLHPRPGTYPAAVSLQLTEHVKVSSVFVPGNVQKRRPDHLRAQEDDLVEPVSVDIQG
jgi:hypothetical protein